ncbi:MAG: bacteriocin family protein [Thaumarchaeota archaeon]|nr:bacteriocin family protein [Nitrososphaerota archaeon]
MSPTVKSSRGKGQVQWSDGVWKALDQAVLEEMKRTRVGAKFLPLVHVPEKQTTVEANVVIVPLSAAAAEKAGAAFDSALSVDESQTNRIQEYWTAFRLSAAQVQAEEHEEMQPNNRGPSTAVSLALRAANILAQAEDLVLFNGQNAAVNSPLFTGENVQYSDRNLNLDLDCGLLKVRPVQPVVSSVENNILLPVTQVIPVHPSVLGNAGSAPRYAENTLNVVSQGISALQGLGHYENYALVLHTVPYADIYQALPDTLIEPAEPISHLVKAGIYGTSALPPFAPVTSGSAPGSVPVLSGLPTGIVTPATSTTPAGTTLLSSMVQFNSSPLLLPAGSTPGPAAVLYTGVLVSLSGNTMDLVRGVTEDSLDVSVIFDQKDQNEQYRFRVAQRFALRLKDPTAVILLLFLDS